MELGIKQLVSVAVVVLVGIMLIGVSDSIEEDIEGSLTAAVDRINDNYETE